MTEPESGSPATTTAHAKTLSMMRCLLHEMNNGLEIIIQANYLLGTVEMSDDGRQWLKILNQGVERVTTLSRDLRAQIHNFDDA